jgi:AcrR family transcriptional regulator
MDATITSLLEAGYAATTTRRVAELAGVSQGAQTHHFPYRVDLVTAAVQHLAEQRIASIAARIAELPEDPALRVPELLDLLWIDFSSDIFTVFVKVWVAAADDRELYDRLVPIERVVARAITEHAALHMQGVEVREDAEGRVTTMLATLRGLALWQRFEPRAQRSRDPWPSVRPVLVELVLGGIKRG